MARAPTSSFGFTLERGTKYRFTLESERTVDIIIHGRRRSASGGTALDLSVDDKRGWHTSLSDAVGERFVQVSPGVAFQILG